MKITGLILLVLFGLLLRQITAVNLFLNLLLLGLLNLQRREKFLR